MSSSMLREGSCTALPRIRAACLPKSLVQLGLRYSSHGCLANSYEIRAERYDFNCLWGRLPQHEQSVSQECNLRQL